MKYLAIIFLVDLGGGQSFSLSREVDTNDVELVYKYMKKEAKATDDQVDTILLLENGDTSPKVVKFWRAENGDFS